jgi:hypothetical protein
MLQAYGHHPGQVRAVAVQALQFAMPVLRLRANLLSSILWAASLSTRIRHTGPAPNATRLLRTTPLPGPPQEPLDELPATATGQDGRPAHHRTFGKVSARPNRRPVLSSMSV